MVTEITPELLRGAFIVGVKRLDRNKDFINELNVFPVPDGDTGTNMSMTVNTALNDIENGNAYDIKSLCKTISQGSLRGARGNSGVILSQLFRGFYKVIKQSENIDLLTIADALTKATETAYRAVMKPKEGTILTVAKAISDCAEEICQDTKDVGEFYDKLVESAKEMLDKTPELLPVLKQAGVVDSGGTGLLCILEGASDYINGRDTDLRLGASQTKSSKQDVVYNYEVSFVLANKKEITKASFNEYREYVQGLGKVNTLKHDINQIEVKLNTNAPGKAITKAVKFGEIYDVSIKNISSKKPKLLEDKSKISEPKKEMGFVSVACGDGLTEIMKSLGADYCISGGQTMNPSTEDIVEAIGNVNANSVFVLPNNKNILLAANQAKDLVNDKKVFVIPTTTIPQGICALINYIPDISAKENAQNMQEQLEFIHSGEVTYAVRDTEIDDKKIKKGDFMGIGDSGILSVEKNVSKCVEKLVESLVDEDSALLSLYYGEDIKETEAKKLATRLGKKFSDLDIDLQYGGQPVYYYVLAVE